MFVSWMLYVSLVSGSRQDVIVWGMIGENGHSGRLQADDRVSYLDSMLQILRPRPSWFSMRLSH